MSIVHTSLNSLSCAGENFSVEIREVADEKISYLLKDKRVVFNYFKIKNSISWIFENFKTEITEAAEEKISSLLKDKTVAFNGLKIMNRNLIEKTATRYFFDINAIGEMLKFLEVGEKVAFSDALACGSCLKSENDQVKWACEQICEKIEEQLCKTEDLVKKIEIAIRSKNLPLLSKLISLISNQFVKPENIPKNLRDAVHEAFAIGDLSLISCMLNNKMVMNQGVIEERLQSLACRDEEDADDVRQWKKEAIAVILTSRMISPEIRYWAFDHLMKNNVDGVDEVIDENIHLFKKYFEDLHLPKNEHRAVHYLLHCVHQKCWNIVDEIISNEKLMKKTYNFFYHRGYNICTFDLKIYMRDSDAAKQEKITQKIKKIIEDRECPLYLLSDFLKNLFSKS